MRLPMIKLSLTAVVLASLVHGSVIAAPIAHWTFDEGSGSIAGDSSGSSLDHTLSISGPTSWSASGRFGGAINTGLGSNLEMLADTVDLGAAWTISGWFRNYHETADWNTLTRGSFASGGDHQIVGENISEHLGVFDNTNHGMVAATPTFDFDSLATDVWHHIAAVGAGGSTAYYVNGAHVGTAAYQSTTDVQWIGGVISLQTFAESLDEISIWDEALTEGQILSLQTLTADSLGNAPTVWAPGTLTLVGLGIGLVGARRRSRRVRNTALDQTPS